jgi:hypothetical protein
MKFFAVFILSSLTAYAAYLFAGQTPWWLFAVGALLAGWVVPLSSFKTWLAAFLGVFLVWFALCFMANNNNQQVLAPKMAEILQIGSAPLLLIFTSAFVGALVAGFAALTGSYLRRKPQK